MVIMIIIIAPSKNSNKTKQKQISSLSSIDLPDVVRLVHQFTSKICQICLQHAANVTGMINLRKIDLALRTSVNQGFLSETLNPLDTQYSDLASSLPMWGMPAACGL
jgi:hypothetical protein